MAVLDGSHVGIVFGDLARQFIQEAPALSHVGEDDHLLLHAAEYGPNRRGPANRPFPEHTILPRCLPTGTVENRVQVGASLQLVKQEAVVDVTIPSSVRRCSRSRAN